MQGILYWHDGGAGFGFRWVRRSQLRGAPADGPDTWQCCALRCALGETDADENQREQGVGAPVMPALARKTFGSVAPQVAALGSVAPGLVALLALVTVILVALWRGGRKAVEARRWEGRS